MSEKASATTKEELPLEQPLKDDNADHQLRRASLHRRLQDPSILPRFLESSSRSRLLFTDFSSVSTNQHWVLEGSGTTSTVQELPDYLELRRIQNNDWANVQWTRGCQALREGDRKAAIRAFRQGLDLVPNHVKLQKAMHEATTTQRNAAKSGLALKSERSRRDALLEQSFAGETNGKVVLSVEDPKYPMLLPDESDGESDSRRHERKRRKKDDKKNKKKKHHKRKHRKQRRRRRRRYSSDSSDSTTNDDSSSRHDQRRRRRKRKRHDRQTKSPSDDESGRKRQRKRSKDDHDSIDESSTRESHRGKKRQSSNSDHVKKHESSSANGTSDDNSVSKRKRRYKSPSGARDKEKNDDGDRAINQKSGEGDRSRNKEKDTHSKASSFSEESSDSRDRRRRSKRRSKRKKKRQRDDDDDSFSSSGRSGNSKGTVDSLNLIRTKRHSTRTKRT